jgi:hypothetical protein
VRKVRYVNINPYIDNKRRFATIEELAAIYEYDDDLELPDGGLKEGLHYEVVKENLEEFILRVFGKDFFFRPIRPGGIMYSSDYRNVRFLAVLTFILVMMLSLTKVFSQDVPAGYIYYDYSMTNGSIMAAKVGDKPGTFNWYITGKKFTVMVLDDVVQLFDATGSKLMIAYQSDNEVHWQEVNRYTGVVEYDTILLEGSMGYNITVKTIAASHAQ